MITKFSIVSLELFILILLVHNLKNDRIDNINSDKEYYLG